MTSEERISHWVVEYYLYRSGNGGTDPETLLSRTCSLDERRELLAAFADVDCVWEVTAPLRDAALADKQQNDVVPVERPLNCN
jgi:hypothetical protein